MVSMAGFNDCLPGLTAPPRKARAIGNPGERGLMQMKQSIDKQRFPV